MTMQKETTNYIRKGATIMVAPENTAVVSAAWTPIGYASEPVKIKIEKEAFPIMSEESNLPLDVDVEIKNITVSGSTGQIGNEQVCSSLGRATTQTIVLGGDTPTAVRNFAVKVVGITQRSGNQAYVHLPRAYSAADVELSFGKKDYSKLDFSFEPLHSSAGVTVDFANATTATTLATDTFTRSAGVGFYRLLGQGSVADNLNTIGGTWLDGEEVMLQIASTASVITLTNGTTGAGHIELDPGMSWVMTTLDDYIILRYTLATTKFVEVARFNSKV